MTRFLLPQLLLTLALCSTSFNARAQIFNKPNDGYVLDRKGRVVAPFANKNQREDKEGDPLFDLYAPDDSAEGIDLSTPHRTNRQIAEWVNTLVIENFNFSQDNLSQNLSKIRPYFTKRGWSEFTRFMKQTKTVPSLLSNIKRGVVDIKLLAGREAVVDITKDPNPRIYSWLVHLPVFVEINVKDRTGTRETAFDIEVFRIKDGPDSNNIVINAFKEAPEQDNTRSVF